MLRKIIKYLFLLGLITGSAYLFLQLKAETKAAPDPFNFLLKESSTIVKYNSDNWSELMELHQQMNKKGKNEDYLLADNVIQWIDTMRSKSSIVPEILNNGPFYISHFNTNNSDQWVLSAGLKNNEQGEMLTALLKKQFNVTFSIETFQNRNYAKTGNYYLLIENEVLFASNAETAIKSVIQTIDTKDFLHKNKDFRQVSNSTSNNAINIWKWNPKEKGNLTAGWSTFEPVVIDNNFQMVGYHFHKDPNSRARGFVPTLEIPFQLLPDRNIRIEYKSITKVKNDRELSFEKDPKKREEYVDYILKLEEECACMPEDLIYHKTQYLIEIEADDKHLTLLNYDNFLDALTDYYPLVDSASIEYKGNPIFKLNYPELYSSQTLSSREINYFSYIENHFLMTEKLEDLEWWITQIRSKKTLEYKGSFIGLKDQITPCDWFLLSDRAELNSSPLCYPFQENEYSGNEFQFLQITDEDSKSFVRLVEYYKGMNGEVVLASESKGPITVQLDSKLAKGPIALLNHYTKEKEIFLQTSDNLVQLYSPSGKLLWKKEVEGEIKGNVYQIDIYKNNKLQMIFNTNSKIYCLDRNGNSVDGFPIQLKANSNSSVRIFDYDKKKKYRILVACTDGQLYNYGVDGKETSGWKYQNTNSNIFDFQHIKIKDKDYILTIADNHSLQVLKRNGRTRVNTEQSLPDYANKGWNFSKSSTLEESSIHYLNTKGELVSKSILNDKSEVIIPNLANNTQISWGHLDKNKSKDFLVVSGTKLKAYDSNGKFLFQYDCDDSITGSAQWIPLGKSESRIVLRTEDLIYLLNTEGELIPNFPVSGGSEILLEDLNLNSLFDLVTVTESEELIIYELN